VLSATVATQSAVSAGGVSGGLLVTALGGLLLVFGLWWTYFAGSAAGALGVDGLSARGAFVWGYGHYLVFAALAALGAGLQVAVDQERGVAQVGTAGAGFTVAVPVAVGLLVIGGLHGGRPAGRRWWPVLVAAGLVVAVAAGGGVLGLPMTLLVMGLVPAGFVAGRIVTGPHPAHPSTEE
jgi:low temperature requirement protein LtrA